MRLRCLILCALTLSACGGTTSTQKFPPGVVNSASPSSSAAATSAAAPAAPTFNPQGLLKGNVTPSFDAGQPGRISVVYMGPLNARVGTMPIVLRNNTSKAISHVDVSAVAHDASGAVVATGRGGTTEPTQLQPGEAALDDLSFDSGTDLSAGATFTFTETTEPADTSSYNTASLTVTQASVSGKSIVGSATNKTGATLQGPYAIEVFCFTDNKPSSVLFDFADEEGDLENGGSAAYSVGSSADSCPNYLVGMSSFFK